MKLAEELYQAGFISYPRTETDLFTPDMDLQVWGECGQGGGRCKDISRVAPISLAERWTSPRLTYACRCGSVLPCPVLH